MQQRATTKRLPPEVFDLPVEKMREGYYTDAYFNHTRQVLLADGRHPRVVMQVFQKRHSYLGGIDEAIAVLKLCADDWDDLTVHALYDGDALEPYEPVLTIEGDYTGFAHLETVYLGTLARRTLITTNVVRVLEAANGKPLIFMPARFDHHRVQAGDGSAVAKRCCSSWPGFASARDSVASGCRVIQLNSSVEAASAPTCAASLAGARRCAGAFWASVIPTAVVATSGPSRCEPQRSCSRARGSSCS